jgi:hypothetical protein
VSLPFLPRCAVEFVLFAKCCSHIERWKIIFCGRRPSTEPNESPFQATQIDKVQTKIRPSINARGDVDPLENLQEETDFQFNHDETSPSPVDKYSKQTKEMKPHKLQLDKSMLSLYFISQLNVDADMNVPSWLTEISKKENLTNQEFFNAKYI